MIVIIIINPCYNHYFNHNSYYNIDPDFPDVFEQLKLLFGDDLPSVMDDPMASRMLKPGFMEFLTKFKECFHEKDGFNYLLKVTDGFCQLFDSSNSNSLMTLKTWIKSRTNSDFTIVGKLFKKSFTFYLKNADIFFASFNDLEPVIGFENTVSLLGSNLVAVICSNKEVRDSIKMLFPKNPKIVAALNNQILKKAMVEEFVKYWVDNENIIKGKKGIQLINKFRDTRVSAPIFQFDS